MSSTYSGYDAASDYGDVVVPPTRGCFRAMIRGPNQSSKSMISYGSSQKGYHRDDKKWDRPKYDNVYYGLLNDDSDSRFEDTFITARTDNLSESSSPVVSEKKYQGKKENNGVSVICRTNNNKYKNTSVGEREVTTASSSYSHAGLLNYEESSGIIDVIDKKDALNWKSSKTTTVSSIASISHRSRISRKSEAYPESLDFIEEVDDLRRKTNNSKFGGCVVMKKPSHRGSHKKSKTPEVVERMHMNKIIFEEEETIPPQGLDSSQLYKFNHSLPSHRVENHEFPQIIFADNKNLEEEAKNKNGYYGEDGFMSKDHHFMNYSFGDMMTTESSPRSKSPKTFSDFSNTSPRGKSSRSRNPSPRSMRSREEEGKFLDHLANTFTTYNSFQKDKRPMSPGRQVIKQLMDELKTSQIPDVLEVDNEEYSDDDVSDVGMASTSGGQNESSNDEKSPSQNNAAYQRKRINSKYDYFDPTIKQVKNLNNYDERSLKWRLREANKENINFLSGSNVHQRISRARMETAGSLMDQDCSASISDDADPSFPFGGPGVSNPPLALSEGIDYLGVDDRIYLNANHAQDIFKDDAVGNRVSHNIPNPSITFPSSKYYSEPIQLNHNYEVSPSSFSERHGPRIGEEMKRKSLSNVSTPNHHNSDSSGIPLARTHSALRSSKYQEINGTAYFSSSSMKSRTGVVGRYKESPKSIVDYGAY